MVRLDLMRKLVLVVVLVLLASHRPAEACRGGPCPPWVNAVGYTFAAGITAGYAYGTGRFIYSDLNDPDQSLGYGVAELSANGLAATLFTAVTIDTARNGSPTAIAWGSVAVLHTTLAGHGVWRIYRERSEVRFPDTEKMPLAWIGGTVVGLNSLYWLSEMGGTHSRAYGITEAAVNAPIAVGLGYLAYDSFHDFRGGQGVLYGGMAAVSTVLVVHGIRTAVAPRKGNKLDFMPTIDGDSAGVSFAGTW